jgi:hypothetical protein
LRLEVGRSFTYTNNTGTAVAYDLTTFVGDKHATNFIKQFRIGCNDNFITENLDFVYGTNILGAIISDSIKSSKPKTYTPISSILPTGNINLVIENKERAACGQYINFRSIGNNTTVRLKYFITIPMTKFNLFDKLRYLLTFFGNWTLEIIPMLDNMIMKIIEINVIAPNT